LARVNAQAEQTCRSEAASLCTALKNSECFNHFCQLGKNLQDQIKAQGHLFLHGVSGAWLPIRSCMAVWSVHMTSGSYSRHRDWTMSKWAEFSCHASGSSISCNTSICTVLYSTVHTVHNRGLQRRINGRLTKKKKKKKKKKQPVEMGLVGFQGMLLLFSFVSPA
jgi:hypothetical protein